MEEQEAASELQIAWHLEGGAPAGAIPTRWVAQDSTWVQLTVARAAILGGTVGSVEEFVRSTRFDLEHSDTQWNDPQLARSYLRQWERNWSQGRDYRSSY